MDESLSQVAEKDLEAEQGNLKKWPGLNEEYLQAYPQDLAMKILVGGQ